MAIEVSERAVAKIEMGTHVTALLRSGTRERERGGVKEAALIWSFFFIFKGLFIYLNLEGFRKRV